MEVLFLRSRGIVQNTQGPGQRRLLVCMPQRIGDCYKRGPLGWTHAGATGFKPARKPEISETVVHGDTAIGIRDVGNVRRATLLPVIIGDVEGNLIYGLALKRAQAAAGTISVTGV